MKSRCEFRAYEDLSQRGFEAFLPSYSVTRRWSDRTKSLRVPMFQGYLFCRFALMERMRVLNAAGVAQIVGFGNTPVPINDSEVRSVQALVSAAVPCVPWPYLEAGKRVFIDRGPLAGVDGVILRAESGKARVVVSVSGLFRGVAAEIERDWISRVQ